MSATWPVIVACKAAKEASSVRARASICAARRSGSSGLRSSWATVTRSAACGGYAAVAVDSLRWASSVDSVSCRFSARSTLSSSSRSSAWWATAGSVTGLPSALRAAEFALGRPGGSWLLPVRDLEADAAIADEVACGSEHRLAADLELLHRPVRPRAGEDEIEEWLAGCDGLPQFLVLGLVPAPARARAGRIAQRLDAQPQHLEHRPRHLGEGAIRILFPVPVGSQLGEAAVARLAFAPFR